jgi:glycosyltransferase involved in cell wall biosynthesis
MKIMSKYSVLMSLYINEDPVFLRKSIESMINQSIPPDEIIIVEDGPITSSLSEVLKKFDENYPGLFVILKSEKNIGLGSALNLGLQNCSNLLVARMDADDISLPDRCEKQLMMFEENRDLALVGSYVNEFYQNEDNIISTRKVPIKHNEIYEFSKRRSAFNHPTVMFKKDKVLNVGGYSNLRRNQDVDLFGRMLYSGCLATNINQVLLLYRTNDKLSKRRKSWQNTKSYIQTIHKLKKIGYSSLLDLIFVFLGQMIMFLSPIWLQRIIYKKFLR